MLHTEEYYQTYACCHTYVCLKVCQHSVKPKAVTVCSAPLNTVFEGAFRTTAKTASCRRRTDVTSVQQAGAVQAATSTAEARNIFNLNRPDEDAKFSKLKGGKPL